MGTTLSAYIIGVVVAIVALIIAAIVANLISYKPDNSDCGKRKMWFYIILVLTLVATFVLCYVIEYSGIKVASKARDYMTAMCIATVISPIIYFVLGLILAKINKHGKIGNWF